jgi:zinc protease
MEERRLRTEDQPESLTYERLWATAFVSHPYRNPVIGWMEDLESLTVKQNDAWYRRWYAPDNATLVVVGDVRPGAVFDLARRHFGDVPRGEVPPPPRVVEPPQDGPRRVEVKAPAEVAYLLIGYHVPVLASAPSSHEPYALDVLAGLLGGGDAARLQRELVRGRELAADVGVGYDLTARSPTLFMIDANPARGRGVDALERAILGQVAGLQSSPVPEEELDRVKAQVVARDVYSRDSMFYQAMRMGILETVGLDWRLVDRYLERIQAVTAGQVQAVARKYLQPANMTVAVLVPQPLDGRPAPRRPGGPADDVH